MQSETCLNETISKLESELPEALRQPTKKKGIAFFICIALLNIAMWLVITPLLSIVLPLQIQEIDPANKVTLLGVLTSLGILTGMIISPLVGKLSDTTTSKLGRRRPWMFLGTIGSIVMLSIAMRAGNIAVLITANILAGFCTNTLVATVNLLLPDQVPPEQRGMASGIVGIAMPLASVVGAIVCGTILKTTSQRYLFIIISFAALALPTTLLIKDKALPKEFATKFSASDIFKSFTFNPRKMPDFSFAWMARFVMLFGQYLITNYMLYYLQDVIHYDKLFPGRTAAQGVATLQTYSTILMVVATIFGGFLSDKLHRRKIFVICASIISAIGLCLIGLLPVWSVILVVNSIIGFGSGVYNSVDNALIIQCLPNHSERGKYMGIMNIANCGAQTLAPLIAVPVINMTHSYSLLYIVGGIVVLSSTFFVWKIKSVR